MKKILLLLIAVYATVAVSAQITDTIVSLTPTNRNVLLEEFTGSNCVWCPDGHRMANELEAANPGRVNVINIYQGPYAANLFTTQFGNELASQSNLYGYPSATINRHIFSGSITSLERFDWADCANQIMSMTSPVNIAAEGTLDWTTRTVNIRVQIYYTSDQAVTSNALNIAIIQDNVLGPQAGGSTYDPDQMVGDQYSHQHVLRHLITGQWGETINTISQGTLIERTYEYEIPEQLGSPNSVDAFLEDLHFIAFVCEGHQEVLTNIEIPIQHVNVPAIDGYILSVNNMENYECDGHGNACFVFRNNGTSPATSLTYTFSVNDSAIQTAVWTGNIPFLDTDTILIPTFDLNKKKDNTLTVHVTAINSENVSINPKSQTISKSVYSGGGRMIFKLETDSYASETSFIFVDPNGDTVLSGGPWPNGKHVLAFNFLPETIGCYRLEVSDSYGDGINNGYGAGNFQLLAENGSQILFDNGKFTNKVTYVIDVTTPATVTDDINVVYVTPTGSGTLSGDSWANATPSVSFALTKAMVNHADVWIAAGTYYGDTTSSNAFTMMDGVNVYGGFAGDEPEDYDLSLRDFETNATILDGQHARRVLYQPTAFNVQTIWDGFTIQNGYNTSGAIGYGGGVSMSNNGGLSHCIIQHNYAYFGGGVNASNSTISNCLISNNTASTGGGTYINNNTTIVNSSIVRNSSDYDATGIYSGDGSCSLINSIVWGNGTSANDNIAGDITCSYSAIEGGYEGEHLIILTELDPPLFVNPSQTSGIDDNTENVDWHLQQGSACINRGNNAYVIDSIDLDGTARIKRDTVDMGCYESDYYSSPLNQSEFSNIIYVTQNGSGTQTGEDWDNATSSISFALSMAQPYLTDIWVAAGTYYGDTTTENAFTMVKGVNVYGGFAGNEPANYDLSLRDFETNTTILDGQHARRVLYQPSSFNTITTWDGFTIQNGQTTSNDVGCGVTLLGNGRLSNCVIQSNAASFTGGVFSHWNSGASNYLYNCVVTNNTSSQGAGGILSTSGYPLIVSNCLISNNTGYYYGGLMSMYAIVVTNTTIVRNMATDTVYLLEGSGITGGYESTLSNCVVWGNGATASDNISGYFNCSYSAIEGGYEGDNNITLSELNPPLFVNPSLTAGASDNTENVDWHLLQGSPCINTGNNTAVTDSLDLDGTARIKHDTVDMGCYESDYGASEACSDVVYEFSHSVCNSYEWNGQTYTQSGEYVQTFALENGCDSVVTLHLSVNYGTHNIETETACESFTWHGVTYTSTGTYTHDYNNADGCASVDTLVLTVNYSSTGDTTAVANDHFDWYEHTYLTMSGDYTHVFTNQSGCDSAVTLHLTVTDPTISVQDTVMTVGYFIWHDMVFTSDTVLAERIPILDGYDSVVIYHVFVTPAPLSVLTVDTCGSYTLNGQTYSETGDYVQTFPTSSSIDSVVVLYLTIFPTDSADFSETACDSYQWNGETFTTSGDYTQTFTNATGCDSVVTLHLTINQSFSSVETVSANESYTWADSLYTASGIYEHTWTTAEGCDSTVSLWLTITKTQYDTTYVDVHDTTYIDVHDTTYVDVFVPVHDTTYVDVYVPVHDTTYIDVHDTTYVNVHDTTYLWQYDTTYVNVPYPVHDTTYVNVHDTSYVDVPYPVHDTTYVDVPYPVHDTTYVDVPYPVHDTTYVDVHDTTYLWQYDTTFVTLHDTTVLTLHDTTYIDVPYPVHDTTYVTLTDTIVLNHYDTTYIDVPYPVHDTTYVTLTDTIVLNHYDTTYIDVPYPVHDTTFVTLTDTVVLNHYDTTYINVPYPVHDTTYVTLTDTIVLNHYDTTYITLHDTITITEPLTWYSLQVLSEDMDKGVGAGSGQFPEGTDVEIAAIPVEGYRFLQWSDGSEANPRTITLNDNLTLTAMFTTVGVTDLESPSWYVYPEQGAFVVKGTGGHQVSVYDAVGKLLHRYSDAPEILRYSVPAAGSYYIQVDNGAAKKVTVVR